MRGFLSNRKALVGAAILFLYFLMATVGPEVVPLDLTYRSELRLRPPSLAHPFGTDTHGVDIFAQIIHGSRDVLLVAFLAAIFSTGIAVAVGITAGFKGGLVDQSLMMLVNVLLTIPQFPIMLIFATVFRVSDPVSFALVLAVWMWAGLARAVRSQTLSLREREFIEAAGTLRLSPFHIVFREILPNIMPYIAINFVGMMRGAINASVGVMFLGIVPFSRTNWGMMLNMATRQTGAIYVPSGIYYAVFPILAIMFFQLGGYLFGHGLDEIFNPRLRAHE
jgi:peptide/nickel transport system permease protein